MPEQPQQQPEKKEKKGMIKFIIIGTLNVVALLTIFIVVASLKKEKIFGTILLYSSIFIGLELLFFIGFVGYKKFRAGKLKSGSKEYSLEEVEEIAEKYMWAKEGIKRVDCINILSEPRAVQLSSGGEVQAYVWLFKEMVSLYRHTYLFISLVNDPKTKGYRKLGYAPTDEEITKYAKQIAKQPLETKISRFTRFDPSTGGTITEETYEPVYPRMEYAKPDASKL